MKVIIQNPNPPIKFRSTLEKLAWEQWLPTQTYLRVAYEPMTFHLAGGKYTPDFMLVLPNKTLLFVEVKGSWKNKGGARSKRILKEAAAQMNFMGKFIALLPKKTRRLKGKITVEAWTIEEYN